MKSSGSRAMLPLKPVGRAARSPLPAADTPGHSLTYGGKTPVSAFSWQCPLMSGSQLLSSPVVLRATLLQSDLILIHYICNDLFPNKVTF